MKKVFVIVTALSGLYIIFALTGLAGLDTDAGGIIYSLVIIATLLFVCSCVFTGAARHGGIPLLAGALGLGLLAVSELYTFAYIYLLQGESIDITVSNYSRPCAYLFFMLTLTQLLHIKHRKIPRIVISTMAAVLVILIFYAVVTDNLVLLNYATLLIAVLCILPAILLLINTKSMFACSVIVLCCLDIAHRLMVLYQPQGLWQGFIVFYPLIYLWLGWALLKDSDKLKTTPCHSERSEESSGKDPSQCSG